jgi:hypothetical protein
MAFSHFLGLVACGQEGRLFVDTVAQATLVSVIYQSDTSLHISVDPLAGSPAQGLNLD